MRQPFRRCPHRLPCLRVVSSQKIPGILASFRIVRGQRFNIDQSVADFDRLVLLIERSSERRRPIPSPHFLTVNSPTPHPPAGIPEPNVLPVRNRRRTAATTESVRVNALSLRITWKIMLPENFSAGRTNTVEDGIAYTLDGTSQDLDLLA